MQLKSPWSLSSREDVLSPEAAAELDSIIYVCAESIRICGILLQPYMPTKASLLLDMLGVKENRRTCDWTAFAADLEYGVSRMETGRGIANTLFPPLAANA